MSNADQPAPETTSQALATWLIVAVSSLSFSTKGVIAKLMYPFGIDPVTVLTLRFGLSLPVFLAVAWYTGRRATHRITLREWLQLLLMAFLGYYLSAILDFTALQYVSVGLERMVLYTYPGLVLLGAVFFLGEPLRRGALSALGLAYLGVVLAFIGELHLGGSGVVAGTLMVLTSAMCYATFVLMASRMIPRIGSTRFMSIVIGLSGIFMLAHQLVGSGLTPLISQPLVVYGYGCLLAVLGTILPGFTLGVGLRRAGPQRFAIIGTIGPVAAIFLAWAILGESVNGLQLVGFATCLLGGLGLSLRRQRPADMLTQDKPLALAGSKPRCRAGSTA